MLLVVWWAWNYTTWVTNELDPESIVVRAAAHRAHAREPADGDRDPGGVRGRALLFAGSYVAIQVGRHAFLTFAAAGPGTLERERAARILIWFVAAGVFWIAGGARRRAARTAAVAGRARDRLRRAARRLLRARDAPARRRRVEVETAHFAERFQLFVIIALGESIVVTGATTAELDLDAATIAAFALAFLGTAALWWLYFNYVARDRRAPARARAGPHALARDGYTYLHVVMVAGVIVAAVGDELVIAHPTDELPGR